MKRKKWTILPVLLGMALQLGVFPPALAAGADAEEDRHFENTAKVLFYDERGGLPPKDFLVEIRETMEGSGTPSPDNPRPINGYRACNIMHVGDDNEEPTILTMEFPEEAGVVMGGTYDALNGRLSVDRAGKLVQGPEDIAFFNAERHLVTINLPGISASSLNTDEELSTLLCDQFYTLETAATWDDNDLFISKTSGGIDVCLKNEAVFNSKESIEAWFRENPVMISYQLEEPQEYYMDCCPFLSSQGANIIWADTGKIKSFTCRDAKPLDEVIRPTLRILAFGNSFTYSTLNYMPVMLEELMPETEIVMGICYDGGCSFARHLTKYKGGDEEMNIPAEYERYSEYRRTVGKWVSATLPYTPQRALDRYEWDIIILQQSVENLHDFDGLCQFAGLITDSLTHPAMLVYNLAPARSPGDPWLDKWIEGETAVDRSNRHFQMIADYGRRALETPYISAVLPSGTAVQNLRTCAFAAAAGDSGYFSKDASGHLQSGIGPLAASYAAACRIAELCRELPKLYGIMLTPTDEWEAEKEFPNWKTNGPCVGVTPKNMQLARKAAMLALKNPFTLSDCSVWERNTPSADAPAA